MMRLSELPAGHKAVIRKFESSETPSDSSQQVDKEDIHLKLMEMGCIPGEEVRILKVAPLGDPISVSIAGDKVSLRRQEASNVWVDEVNKKVRLAY